MKKLKRTLESVVLLMVIALLAGCNSKVTIDLNKYVSFASEGYDSMGTATYTFDKVAFDQDFSGKVKLTSHAKKEMGSVGKEIGDNAHKLLFTKFIDMDLDRESGLSNGDTITLKWDINDERVKEFFNVELVYSDIPYKVEGLTAVGTIDPFENFTIEFTGISPKVQAELHPNYDNAAIQYVNFDADIYSYFRNGDEIKVTASLMRSDDYYIEHFGAVPETAEKTFKVEGMPYYANKAEQLTDDVIEAMKQKAISQMQYHIETYWSEREKFQAMNYLGYYFLNTKDEDEGDLNYVYLVYQVQLISCERPVTYYYFTEFRNVIVNADGTCSVDIDRITTPYETYYPENTTCYYQGYETLEELYEDMVEDKMDYYTYESTVVVPESASEESTEEGVDENATEASDTDASSEDAEETIKEEETESTDASAEVESSEDAGKDKAADKEKAADQDKATDKDNASDKTSEKNSKKKK